MSAQEHQVTREMLTLNFNRGLEEALKGNPPTSESDLSYEVDRALADIAIHYPDGEHLVPKARKEFQAQLDSQ